MTGLIYRNHMNISMTKIACFDLDWTLIKTKSGKKFPINADDYQPLYSNTLTYLDKYRDKGYHIKVITNQLGIEKGKITKEDIINKIDNIVGKESSYFISIHDDIYRKPYPGVFDFIFNNHFLDANNINKIFYVGDAAGDKGRYGDINFAHNVKIRFGLNMKFYLPEEFFLHEKHSPKPSCPEYPIVTEYFDKNLTFDPNTVVILMGYPGSGKSYFAENNIMKPVYILNNDIMGATKVKNEFNKLLKIGNNVIIIDNLNYSKKTREYYITLGKQYSYQIIGIHIVTSEALSKNFNKYRYYMNPYKSKQIPEIVYRIYKSKFEQMDIEEGYNEIETIQPKLPKIKYCF